MQSHARHLKIQEARPASLEYLNVHFGDVTAAERRKVLDRGCYLLRLAVCFAATACNSKTVPPGCKRSLVE